MEGGEVGFGSCLGEGEGFGEVVEGVEEDLAFVVR